MKAFPNSKFNNEDSNGMELRDYFAAKAMELTYTFWMQDYYKLGFDNGENESDKTFSNSLIAETAYEMADAMLKARNLQL
jgi:hypothetical protein